MIEIPTFNDTSASFEQVLTLGAQDLQVTLTWNGRGQHWYMDLHLPDGTPLVLSRKLVPVLPILYSHRALVPIVGDFALIPESEGAPEYPTFEGLGTTHKLYWMDETELETYEVSLGIR